MLYRLMSDPKTGVERKTRMYRLRSHKDCFIGSDCVDFLMTTLELDSRDEAGVIGEALMHHGLIQHVLRSEPFQDSRQFLYRFVEPSVSFLICSIKISFTLKDSQTDSLFLRRKL